MRENSNLNDGLKNYILAALPEEDFARIKSNLEFVTFELGEVIYEFGEKMDYVYFPTTAIISLLYIMENGSTAEIGVIGNDGIVGVSLFWAVTRRPAGR